MNYFCVLKPFGKFEFSKRITAWSGVDNDVLGEGLAIELSSRHHDMAMGCR